MAEHDGLPVAGYRPQSDDKVGLVNENKWAEERILRTLDALGARDDIDKRFLAIGRTHLELAFMAINLAIFQPGRAELPEDDDDPTPKPSAASPGSPAATSKVAA